MKKTTVSLIAFGLAAAQPAWAERNPADPYEPYNRAMFKINDTADKYVLAPVARGYRTVTPKPVRQGVSNFFNNLRDVVSMGSNLLRLDIKRASEDFVRVGVNTTFGIGGLINIADAGGIPNNKNTLGDTLATWGWKNSNYFVFPLTGPSTVRDSVGSAVFIAYPVNNAVFKTTPGRVGALAANTVNTREQFLDVTDSLEGAAIDKYAYTRDIYMRMRAQQTGAKLPQGSDDNIDIDDLVEADDSPASSTELPAAQKPAAEEYVPIRKEGDAPDISSAEPQTQVLALWKPENGLQ